MPSSGVHSPCLVQGRIQVFEKGVLVGGEGGGVKTRHKCLTFRTSHLFDTLGSPEGGRLGRDPHPQTFVNFYQKKKIS